jgi:MoaA/NifB/PqqE/SkfB family radical SAM enzyme
MCDIWKIREPRQLPFTALERQLESFEKLGVQWVALTGGEPQRHSHFPEFTAALRARGIRVTILTAGVLLEADAQLVAASVDDIIVSLDGPPEVHDRVRRIPNASTKLESGVRAVKAARTDVPISARCTVQRANHHALSRTAECAKAMGLDSISFLAADLTSHAFNRPLVWGESRQKSVALDEAQLEILQEEVERLIAQHTNDVFVVESPEKLRSIVRHFRAHLGHEAHVAPRCNAPWVSAVIEASGEVRPCFFHPSIGSVHEKTFGEVVNSLEAMRFRADLEVERNAICQRCVCSLFRPIV